jgi:hypothetical protein
MRVFVACLLALGSASASAHHGSALYYDVDNVATVEGDVVAVAWRNPHVTLELRRTDDAGANEVWEIEGSSANSLLRVGVERDAIAVGSHVIITGALSRHGLPAMAGHVVTFADGTDVPIWPRPARLLGQEIKPAPLSAAAAEAARSQARGIFRVWARPDLQGLFLENGYLPLTPAAVAAREAWNPLTDDPVLDCIARGMPSVMNAPLPVEFVDRGDSILMRLEEWDRERTIHVAGAVDAATQPRTPLGYSVGRWEGNTLIVTTTRMSDEYFDDTGIPQSESAAIVERFTLSDDETRLDYESIHDDPFTFAEPARQSSYWDWVPGEQIRRFDCALR